MKHIYFSYHLLFFVQLLQFEFTDRIQLKINDKLIAFILLLDLLRKFQTDRYDTIISPKNSSTHKATIHAISFLWSFIRKISSYQLSCSTT